MSETTYRFRSGPVDIEVTTTENDDHESAITNALDTAESIMETRELGGRSRDVATVTSDAEEPSSDSDTPPSTSNDGSFDDDFVELANRCQITPGELDTVIDIDSDRKEPPYLLVSPESLGNSRRERQMHASLAILLSWQSYYGREHVSPSELKEALRLSGIDSERMYHMYGIDGAERFFEKSGGGDKATVKLIRPGMRKARKFLGGLVDE